MLATRDEISRVIPHAGDMCLLDGVLECDAQRIRCFSRSHRDERHPLRMHGELAALCGIEYAAQAMAVHGAWSAKLDSKPRAGFLAALRDVQCMAVRLDTLTDDLVINAEKLMGDEDRCIYQFSLHAGKFLIMSGRATVVLDADKVSA